MEAPGGSPAVAESSGNLRGTLGSVWDSMQAALPQRQEQQPSPGPEGNGKRILIVDDAENNRLVVGALLESLGYRVEVAGDGLDALAKIELGIELVLLDVLMPGLDGFGVTRRLRDDPRYADLPVIMMTVLDNREDRLRAIEAGANDFIAKPVDRTELQVRIGSQLKLKESQDALKRHRLELEDLVAQRTAELRSALAEMAAARRRTYEAYIDTIRRLVLAAGFKDPGTAQHIGRLGLYAAVMASALHLPDGEAEILRHAITMHDVGKIGIPDAILTKPGRLTAKERELIQSHTWIGGRLLADSHSELMRTGEVIALTHHEKWDGSGYPRGLAGEEIPLMGRLCAVIDVFDALTTRRPYRDPLPPEEALEMMLRERGRHFDPALLDLFAAHRDEIFAVHASLGQETWQEGPRAAAETLP